MQGWYEAGFFENSLLVKREDVNYFEPLDALILKVKNSKIPFLSPWPSTSITDPFTTTAALKQPLHQQSFNNNPPPPFLPTPLPRLNNRSSPWENNPASSAAAASWLSNQNDPQYNNRPLPSVVRPLSQIENLYTTDGGVDYQQLAMSQQMEQQYLSMLRQNQQHHIQLQQRMVQQQQQQLLLQQQHMFMNSQKFEHVISPTVPQIPINSSSRGWNSTPGTPGIIDIAQNPWSSSVVNKQQDDSFIPSALDHHRSRSPSKTQVEENNDDPLTFTLSNMTIIDPIENQIELPKVIPTTVASTTLIDTTATATTTDSTTPSSNTTIDMNTTTPIEPKQQCKPFASLFF